MPGSPPTSSRWALLVASTPFTDDKAVAYALLLLATAFLGAGFGLTVPAINTFTAAFHPATIDSSVLALNALLGLGTALGAAVRRHLRRSRLLVGAPGAVHRPARRPALSSASGCRCATGARHAAAPTPRSAGIPPRFWLYAGFAVLYGICETMNGNWSQLDMTTELGASTTVASITLTAFWAMVTVGRVLFAAIQRWFPTRRTYRLLPFVLAGAFVAIALLSTGDAAAGVVAFGARRSRLLGAAAAHDQLRLRRTLRPFCCGARARDRRLPAGLRAGRVRRRPASSRGVTLPAIFACAAVAAGVMAVLPSRSPGRA